MKEKRAFATTHKEFELLSEYTVPPYLLDEYIRNDSERANASVQYPIVYDCIEPSPYYGSEDPSDVFIDEKDLIELPPPSDTTEGLINEPYQKKFFFNPNNLPYQLERACAYS